MARAFGQAALAEEAEPAGLGGGGSDLGDPDALALLLGVSGGLREGAAFGGLAFFAGGGLAGDASLADAGETDLADPVELAALFLPGISYIN